MHHTQILKCDQMKLSSESNCFLCSASVKDLSSAFLQLENQHQVELTPTKHVLGINETETESSRFLLLKVIIAFT